MKLTAVVVTLLAIFGTTFGGLISRSLHGRVAKEDDSNRKDNFDERGNHFESDIILTPSFFSGIANPKTRWPNSTLPYKIDESFSKSERSIIHQGMEDITSHTCIKFVERTEEEDFIFIKKGDKGSGCNSHVGRNGGQQKVNLQVPGCLTKGIVSHELIHAIGFKHEHSRSDRDDYIVVNYENIQPKYHYAFKKYGPDVVSTFGVSYDFGSIMHYSSYAFSTSSSHSSITTKHKEKIGQRVKLSPKDIQKIKNMYECPE